MNDWKYPCITVTSGMSGFFAVMLVWNDEYGGFAEPEETGEGRYADQADAIQEAEAWAEAEDVPFYPPKLVTEPARQDVVAQLLEIFPDMQVIELPARPVQQNSTGGTFAELLKCTVKHAAQLRKESYDKEKAEAITAVQEANQVLYFDFGTLYRLDMFQAADAACKETGLLGCEYAVYRLLEDSWNDILDWANESQTRDQAAAELVASEATKVPGTGAVVSTGGKPAQTMETAVSEWLCNKGLWPDEATAVIETMKNGSQAAEFEKRWSESADDPAQASVLAAFLFVAKFTAIGWLAIHKPHHFALTLLEKEARNE